MTHTRHQALIAGLTASAFVLSNFSPRAPGREIGWHVVPIDTRASFRGLAVAAGGAIWVGGSQGTVIRSTDAGATWSVDSVPGARHFDLRGVAAVDASIAYVAVSSADTGRVYKTTDGGHTWQLQYRDERPGVFLDGAGCWTPLRCLAAGDPIDGHFLVVTTDDGGAHWAVHDAASSPTARSGDGAFAASNTALVLGTAGRAWIATGGGPTSRVWRTTDYGVMWRSAETPVGAATASAGIFSLAFCDDDKGIAVGGDYRLPDGTGAHVAVSVDGGGTWTLSDTERATPYLSGAACIGLGADGPAVVAVGPSGTYQAADAQHWARVARDGFNAVVVVHRSRLVAVGGNGVVAVADAPGLHR